MFLHWSQSWCSSARSLVQASPRSLTITSGHQASEDLIEVDEGSDIQASKQGSRYYSSEVQGSEVQGSILEGSVLQGSVLQGTVLQGWEYPDSASEEVI